MTKSERPIVILDQAPGFKQIDILEAYGLKYQKRIIIGGKVNERRKKLPPDVVWERVIKYDPSSNFGRLYTWIIGSLQMLWLVLTKYRDAELLIITNPPLSTFIPLVTRNTYDLLIFDLYPDALAEYNYISKKSWIFKIWAKANKIVFKRARRLFTLSEGMKQQVSEYAKGRDVEIVPMWTDNIYIKPIPKSENHFVKEHNLSDKFVVMYSGNLGRTHPVEILVDIARKLKDNTAFHFLIIGGGHKYDMLKKLIEESGLSNIQLMEWQPPENIPFTMSAASVGVVTLDPEASRLSVPSKIYDLMSVGVPILAVAAEDAEVASLLAQHQIGKCFSSEHLDSMVDFLIDLQQDQLKYSQMAANSLRTSSLFSAKNAMAFL